VDHVDLAARRKIAGGCMQLKMPAFALLFGTETAARSSARHWKNGVVADVRLFLLTFC
jgi:hypothetical protein